MQIYRYSSPKVAHKIPFFDSPVQAGFPSPANDSIQDKLDISTLLVEHPRSTYFVRIEGYSMRDVGIMPGDIAVVDKAINLSNKDIVIAFVNGEATIKRYLKTKAGFMLIPENEEYKAMSFKEGDEVEIFGVVTSVIKKMR